MTDATTGTHPAPFTESIIEALADIIPYAVPSWYTIHDPFAGEGVRLGALCDRIGYKFTGADLEDWKGKDPRVIVGDSTSISTYPRDVHAIVTSPTYNNGVNDHFEPKDASRRLTYRVRAGHALHENNTGRYSGRSSKRGESEYWRITEEVVDLWPDIAIVNVKDSVRGSYVYPLVALWKSLLNNYGYTTTKIMVPCPGWRFGTNGDLRVDEEAILIGHRT